MKYCLSSAEFYGFSYLAQHFIFVYSRFRTWVQFLEHPIIMLFWLEKLLFFSCVIEIIKIWSRIGVCKFQQVVIIHFWYYIFKKLNRHIHALIHSKYMQIQSVARSQREGGEMWHGKDGVYKKGQQCGRERTGWQITLAKEDRELRCNYEIAK